MKLYEYGCWIKIKNSLLLKFINLNNFNEQTIESFFNVDQYERIYIRLYINGTNIHSRSWPTHIVSAIKKCGGSTYGYVAYINV